MGYDSASELGGPQLLRKIRIRCITPPMKKLTKSQLLEEIAVKMRGDFTKKDVGGFLEALQEVVVEQLKGPGVVTLPGMLKITLKDKPATPERPGINPFTKEAVTIKAKPASKTVKAVALKVLKDDIQ